VKNGEKPIANPFVMLREEFDDWAVLFNPDTGHGFGPNPTGVYLWKLLDGEHSIDDMLEALRRDADGVPLEAGEHLIAFVGELAEQSLAGWEGERVQDHRRRISSCPT
jgi:SynChlorMet cassette protein ScmD